MSVPPHKMTRAATRKRNFNGRWQRADTVFAEIKIKYIDPANYKYHKKATISVYDFGRFEAI